MLAVKKILLVVLRRLHAYAVYAQYRYIAKKNPCMYSISGNKNDCAIVRIVSI